MSMQKLAVLLIAAALSASALSASALTASTLAQQPATPRVIGLKPADGSTTEWPRFHGW